MHVTIGGKRWKLQFVSPKDSRSVCDGAHVKNKEIRVARGLKGEERLEVLIHELLHACDWNRAEEHVETVAKDIARVLTRLGY